MSMQYTFRVGDYVRVVSRDIDEWDFAIEIGSVHKVIATALIRGGQRIQIEGSHTCWGSWHFEPAPDPNAPPLVDDTYADIEVTMLPLIQVWTEVRVSGQPDGGYPPYEFTFRSDREHWRHLARVVSRAHESWTDVEITTRECRLYQGTWQPYISD